MSRIIRNTDFGDFSAEGLRELRLPRDKNWSDSLFAVPSGQISFAEQHLRDDLSIVQGRYSMSEHTSVEGAGDGALLEIQFNLSAHDIHYVDHRGSEQVAPAQSGNIVYLAGADNAAKIHFKKELAYDTFDIHLPLGLLDAYAGESGLMDSFIGSIHTDYSAMLSPQRLSIDPKIYNSIADIKGCRLEGLARKIYLESKVYELIALLTDSAVHCAPRLKLSREDRERIHYASCLLQERLDVPMTIMELSRRVGINQTKLKSGFRELFGTTVFGYLQDIKMHQAKRALLDSDLSIQEIGFRLGYQSTSNFSIAFKKFHGCSPMKLRGQQA